MPNKFPDSIRNMPNFKEMRAMGIELAAKNVLEKDYEGEFEKSIKMYEKALVHFSKNDTDEIADTYQNLGCSLWEVKRREDAIEAWKTSLKFYP